VRLIAATNQKSRQLVREGKFRDAFIFAQRGANCHAAAARTGKRGHPDSCPRISAPFLQGKPETALELVPDAMDALLLTIGPGNIRELRTAIEHGVAMGTKQTNYIARSADGGSTGGNCKVARWSFTNRGVRRKTSPLDLHETERRLIAQALAATNGNVTAAAKKTRHQPPHTSSQINEINLAKTSKTTGRSCERHGSTAWGMRE